MHGQGEIEHLNGQKRKGNWENDIHIGWLLDEISSELL